LHGLRSSQINRAEHEKSGLLAEELLRLARESREPWQLLSALVAMSVTSYWQGEFSQALEYLEENLNLYDPQKHRGHEYLSSSANVGVFALFYLAWTLLHLGYPDQALTRARKSLSLARELSHPFSEGVALSGLIRVHLERGDSQASLKMADALIALSDDYGFPFWHVFGTFIRYALLTEEGQLQEGIVGMRSVLEGIRARGAVMGLSWYLSTLAWAHGKAEAAEEGLAVVAEAVEFVVKTGERFMEAELHRVKGELLLARTPADPAGAEASFRDALEVARRQSEKSYELRAATSLASLWQRQGRKEESRELLAPVYSWFTEGFDTRDLKEAKVLLEALA
jgi:predicted ATPase